ncbi:MAG: hypothetical protein RLZZ210_327 [Pseudomonadota bacterium]|jgi:hypothetical protein
MLYFILIVLIIDYLYIFKLSQCFIIYIAKSELFVIEANDKIATQIVQTVQLEAIFRTTNMPNNYHLAKSPLPPVVNCLRGVVPSA